MATDFPQTFGQDLPGILAPRARHRSPACSESEVVQAIVVGRRNLNPKIEVHWHHVDVHKHPSKGRPGLSTLIVAGRPQLYSGFPFGLGGTLLGYPCRYFEDGF